MTCPQTLRAVLFDLDGTLVKTGPEIAAATNAMLAEMEYALIPPDTIALWVGGGAEDLVLSVLAHSRRCTRSEAARWSGFDEAMVVFRRHYAAHTGSANRLYPGVLDCLRSFQSAGIAMAIVTNKDTVFARKALAVNGIDTFFDPVLCGDSLTTRKPDPEGVAQVLSRLGVTAADAVFIGDSAVDIETARRAGMVVWGFSGGYNRGRDIRDDTPDAVFDAWSEVTALACLSQL